MYLGTINGEIVFMTRWASELVRWADRQYYGFGQSSNGDHVQTWSDLLGSIESFVVSTFVVADDYSFAYRNR